MGSTDFIEQLRRHTIQHYGQHRLHNGLLSDPQLCEALRCVVEGFRAQRPDPCAYDDAYVDAVPSTRGPAWLRRAISIPRCTNSLSLYLFMVVDALVFVGTVKVARALVERRRRSLPHDTDDWLVREGALIVRVCGFVVTILVNWLLFRLLHRRWDWIEEPHLLLTVTLALYLLAYIYLDHVVPDF